MTRRSPPPKLPRSWRGLLLALVVLSLSGLAESQDDAALRPEVEHLVPPPSAPPETLRLVSFNVHYAADLPRLIEGIRASPVLRAADIFLLQEIESHAAEGASRARKLAQALGMNYVYAPARRTHAGGTHGLAILSRFPLAVVEVLPLKRYDLGFNTRRRIALAATVDVGGHPLRLYNVHLDTRLNIKDRLAQLRPVVAAARRYDPAPLVVGGDFNTNAFRWLFHVVPVFRSDQAGAVDDLMKENGFDTPLASSGPTSRKALLNFRIDALYTRGLTLSGHGVERSVDVSDHLPVWLDFAWPAPPATASRAQP